MDDALKIIDQLINEARSDVEVRIKKIKYLSSEIRSQYGMAPEIYNNPDALSDISKESLALEKARVVESTLRYIWYRLAKSCEES